MKKEDDEMMTASGGEEGRALYVSQLLAVMLCPLVSSNLQNTLNYSQLFQKCPQLKQNLKNNTTLLPS